MLAMAPQGCRSSNSLLSGLQHCSNDRTVEHACEFCRICLNPLCSLNARCSLQNWSSIFSTSTSKNFCLSQLTCCCKQAVKSLESTEHKSRASTGLIDLMSCSDCHSQRKPWIFQQQSAVRNLQLLTQCSHVSPSHEHCPLILIHPYLSGQKLQLHQSNPQPPVSLTNSFVTDIHVMGHS